MQTTDLPVRIPVPFANSGTKNTIPVASQIGITAGRASFTDGFPPLTFTPVAAGGVPPYGADFNGILNSITTALRWYQAGMDSPFDAGFAAAASGYPKGALLPNSTFSGYWYNMVDGNSTAPEVTNASLTGWVPGNNPGITAITGLAATTVTLTALQAAKERITLAGALTANVSVVLTLWAGKRWTVTNSCTGAFTVTVIGPTGTGIVIPVGLTVDVQSDGTNIVIPARNLLGAGLAPATQAQAVAGTDTTAPATSLSVAQAMQSAAPNVSIATGTADAIVGSYSPAIAALTNGMSLLVRAASANTTTLPTFTPNSGVLTAKWIVKGNNLALTPGDIAGPGHWLELQYDSALDKFVLQNPATGVVIISGIGYGQTWQNVSSSRASNTTYTNTTGKPIFISISSMSPTAASSYGRISISVNGLLVADATGTSNGTIVPGNASTVVPAGATYSVGITGSSWTWLELR